MSKKIPVFPQPENTVMPVWRYIDLPQLIHLLSTNKLYLPRADLLNDAHEGALPRATKNKRSSKLSEDHMKLYEKFRKCLFISSWHMSEEESYAMWRIYSLAPFGLAIRTTYKNLASCFTDKDMHIGCVNYIDYFNADIPDDNNCRHFMNKRKCFAYEQEIRLIKDIPSAVESCKDNPLGIEIPINLKKLIQYIYVSPFAEEWYYNVVNVVLKKFAPSFTKKLKWSNIKNAPLF